MSQQTSSRVLRSTFVLGLFVGLVLIVVALPVVRADSTAFFSGTASIHVVGETSVGAIVEIAMSAVAYDVTVTSSSLTLVAMGMTMGGPIDSGRLFVGSSGAHGGGILGGTTPSQVAFKASSSGGQFQCLMAGFTAGFPLTMDGMTLTIIQMDVHGDVTPGTYVVS